MSVRFKLILQNITPDFILDITRPIRHFVFLVVERIMMIVLLKTKSKSHNSLIDILRKKAQNQKLIVHFFVYDISFWKLETLYRLFENSDFFIPYIVVLKKINEFDNSSLYYETKKKLSLDYDLLFDVDSNYKDDIRFYRRSRADIVFTSEPSHIFDMNYHISSLRHALVVYIPYCVNLLTIPQIMINNHTNLSWINYIESDLHYKIYNEWLKSYWNNKFTFVSVGIVNAQHIEYKIRKIEKQNKKMLIIWAPHWSVDKDNPLLHMSTFLDFHEAFLELALKYENYFDFVFKPHPELKESLYRLSSWGRKKTDYYYRLWESNSNKFLNESSYIDLFNESDALIHDSGTFMVEFLFTGKPVAYLKTNMVCEDRIYNKFGIKALQTHKILHDRNEIELFLLELINSVDSMKRIRENFFNEYLLDFHYTASMKIFEDIKYRIGL